MQDQSIQAQFNRVAREYDQNRRKFISCFDDFYIDSTALLSETIRKPERVLDLGSGTGLLSAFWYEKFPESQFVLNDIALDMLDVAKERFSGLDNVSYLVQDYTESLPEGNFDAIISALSIHHLEDPEKQKLFNRIYEVLPEGGVFVNYDQFCFDDQEISDRMDSFWENRIESSGLGENDIALWKERRKLDKECSIPRQIEMLKKAGFSTVECLFSSMKFAVILAIK